MPFLAIRLDNLPVVGSTKALGQELGLPDSPAIVLAGLSHGNPAVLLVDQLDAMSVVSGRNPELWQVFEELVEEVRQHPNMRLLLACRAFDLEHDPRLARLVKQEGLAQRFDLDLLPVETVKLAVKEGGGAPERLLGRELELLRTPFLLYLFLQGEPANPTPFGGRQELFARFWRAKQQKAALQQVDFARVIGVLVDELSRGESISASANRLDSVAKDANVLVSDNVLVFENGRYRFFHESFFDYAFARRFVGESRNLVHFLTSECAEQHLFRRSQVRQVLAYQREDNREFYLATLIALLNHADIRVHVKKLAFDWLAQLEDPSAEEWEIIEPLLKDAKLHWAAFNVLWGRLAWFDLLENLDVLSRLFAREDAGFVDLCARILGQQEFLAKRSPQVAKLLRPYLCKGDAWKQRLRGILQFGHFHASREMFDLVLELLEDGLFDGNNTFQWHALTEMAEQRPEFAVEFLARALRRAVAQSAARGEGNPFAEEGRSNQMDTHFIRTTAQKAPALYAERITPIIKELVLANARPAKCGGYYDEIWPYLSYGADHDTHEALLGSTKGALQELARTEPVKCEAILAGWQELEHKTLRFLLLCAWLGNPNHFAERAAQHLINHPIAFEVGYDVFSGDDPERAGIALLLLKAISPLVADGTHLKLESAIRGYKSSYEKQNPKFRGSRELALWTQLQSDRLNQDSRLRIEELRRKFPERKLTSYEKRMRAEHRIGGFVPPPIPTSAFSKMTDDQWVKAFRRYSSTKGEMRRGRLIGSALELHTPVQHAAKADRKRFAALALKLPDDILPIYFDAILWGLVDESRQAVKGGGDGQSDIELPNDAPLATTTLLQVVQRVHRLPGKPCGKAICRLADALAKRPVPVELVEIVADYAILDPDPETEVWDEDAGPGQKYYGGDPLSAGINSARGSAADSFSRFLFAHPEMAERLYPYVKTLAHDKSIAVRAVNIQGLLALLNTHREEAVALFLETCEECEPLWAIHPVEDFLYYATFKHYAVLRPLLRRMLSSSESEARHAAARQVTLAAFRHREAESDLEVVLAGGEECRRAAAEIYSVNVHHESVRETCIANLKTFFNDSCKRVRDTASNWFRERFGGWTEWQRNLLSNFVQSQAFLDGGSECMMNIDKTPGPLPPEFLKVAQKAVDVFEEKIRTDSPHAFGFSYHLPALVIRFYEQSKADEARRECLDLLDRMLSLGMAEAENELRKADR